MGANAKFYRALEAVAREPIRPIMAIADDIGATLNRMVATQMEAFPSCWTDAERREEAERVLFSKARARVERREQTGEF